MSDDLEYKGYKGSVEFSSEDRLLFGKVLFIDSLIMYHAKDVDELETNFRQAIDDYINHCERNGKSPNKPFSGTFNVRIGAARHRSLAQIAYRSRTSINEVVSRAIDCFLDTEGAPVIVNNHSHHHETVLKVVTHEQTVVTQMATEEKQWKVQPAIPAGAIH